MNVRKYTDEEREFFAEYVPGHSYKEIRKEFEKRFGEITMSQIKNYIGRNKLSTGRNGRFEKGHVPANKGKKMSPELYAKVAPTMFKKGNVPQGHREVGSERVSVDGFIEVKVAEPNRWRFKSRVVWEEHNGPVPEGHVITYLDGNPLNCDISNLMLITRAEHLYLNRYGYMDLTGEEKKTAALAAKLQYMIERKKESVKE